jgi:hypothetical protein
VPPLEAGRVCGPIKTRCVNCPINEAATDGTVVRRCYRFLTDAATCPRHGNVRRAVVHYEATGKLTRGS